MTKADEHPASGRRVIVTGGATSIGAAVVRRFAGAGWCVVIADIAAPEGESLATELGPAVLFHPTDLADDAAIQGCVDATAAAFGGVDAIVHAACSYVDGGAAATRADWRRSVDVNLAGAALLVAAALPRFGPDGGAIVLFGSISARVAQAGRWLYPASKAALLQLTRSMALDLAPRGIRVNTLSPGKVWSVPLARKHGDDRARADAAEGGYHMTGRLADADEIAGVALFLCSPDASFVTGADIPVDGGYAALGPEGKQATSGPVTGRDRD